MKRKDSLQLLKFAISQTHHYFKPVILENLALLIGVSVLVQVQGMLFLYLGKEFQYSNQSIYLLCQVGTALSNMVETTVLIVLIPLRLREKIHGLPREDFNEFFKKTFFDLFIESIRMFAFIIMWGLLLLIPGIYKQMRWYFMPFIVMFDKDKGEIDVLDKSHKLTDNIVFLLFAMVLVDFVIELAVDSAGLMPPWPLQIGSTLVSGLITSAISIYALSLLYFIYEQRSQEVDQEKLDQAAATQGAT